MAFKVYVIIPVRYILISYYLKFFRNLLIGFMININLRNASLKF